MFGLANVSSPADNFELARSAWLNLPCLLVLALIFAPMGALLARAGLVKRRPWLRARSRGYDDRALGPTLDVIVESDRGLVSFLDMGRSVKLASRNPGCSERDIVSPANDAYPELQLDQVEVERRDLVSPSWAVVILRHFLLTGEAIDLVPWPPDDWDNRPAAPGPPAPRSEEIPF